MTKPPDYTDEEWQKIVMMPLKIVAAMMMVDSSGYFGKLREAKPIDYIMVNRSLFGEHPLISAVLTELSREGDTMFIDKIEYMLGTDGKITEEKLLNDLQQAVEILANHNSAVDVKNYKQFLLILAESTARATKEGWFGLGKRVSRKERKLIDSIRVVLNLVDQ